MIINEYLFIPPNWKSPVFYRRRWFTNLMSSLDNTEQRSMLYTWPRRSLSYSILTSGYSESAYLKERLYKSLPNVWGVPFWQDETFLTSVALVGQKIINLDTRWRDFDVGGRCVLYSSPIDWEVGVIGILGDSQITLQENLQRTWQQGVKVYPILAGRVKNELPLNLVTSTMSELSLEVTEEFNSAVIRRIGNASSYMIYKGFPLFDKNPNWGDNIELKFIHPFSHLAFLGKSYSFSHYGETEFGLKMSHLVRSKIEIRSLLDFFDYCMGRWGNFWYPSNQQDIRITQPFLSSATQLTIENIRFQDYWLYKKAGENLKIDWPDGSYVCVRVSGFTPPDTLVLASPIGKAGTLHELPRITASFLYFGRFAQDEMQIEYLTDRIGKIPLSVQTCFKDMPVLVS